MDQPAAPKPPSAASIRVLRGLVEAYEYPGKPSLQELGDRLGMTKGGVRDHLRKLEPHGLVEQLAGTRGYWAPTPAGKRRAKRPDA